MTPICSIYEVAGDLCQFMSLFDLLIQQFDDTEDSSSSLLDRDLKNSVLGEKLWCFVRF